MPPVQKAKAQHPERMNPNNGGILNVFRYLTRRGNCLVAGGEVDGDNNSDKTHEFGASGARDTAQAITASAEEIRQWLADDFIEKGAAGFVLSAAGRAWLKRQLAAAEPFQEQHQARASREIDIAGVKRHAIVNDAESPLAWLASRRDKNGKPLLESHQFAAGERLRSDYHYAGLTARVTASWDPAAASRHGSVRSQNGSAMLSDNVLAARQRVVQALAIVGPELSGILVDVCCHLKGLEEAEKAEGWPQRSGKVVLQLALSRLARHYGLIGDGEVAAVGLKRRLQHWGSPDYRPASASIPARVKPEAGKIDAQATAPRCLSDRGQLATAKDKASS